MPHPVAAVAFLLVLAAVEYLRFFLALSSVLPFPLLWFHVRLRSYCSRPWLVLGALPLFFWERFVPLPAASLRALLLPAHFLVVLLVTASLRFF